MVFQDQMRIKKVLTEGGPTLTTFQWGGGGGILLLVLIPSAFLLASALVSGSDFPFLCIIF